MFKQRTRINNKNTLCYNRRKRRKKQEKERQMQVQTGNSLKEGHKNELLLVAERSNGRLRSESLISAPTASAADAVKL